MNYLNQSESDIGAQVTPSFVISSSARGDRRVSGPTRRSTKGGWTPEEDKLLMNAVDKYKGKNWKKIAECVPRRKDKRNDVQCQHRWLKVLNPNLNKGPWTKEEDDILSELAKVYVEDDKPKWSKISKQLPGRIGKQCRERWHNHLNPAIKKTPWTREEELILVNAQRGQGNKWAKIAKLLPGRTENNIKNHWNCSVKKRLKQFSNSNILAERCIPFQIMDTAKSPQREIYSLDLTLGPMDYWKGLSSSTRSAKGEEETISSDRSTRLSSKADISYWTPSRSDDHHMRLPTPCSTPQSSNDSSMCVQELKEIRKIENGCKNFQEHTLYHL